MPWLALAPRAWPLPRPRLGLVKAAPPPDWEQLLALVDAQAPTLARAFMAALTWEDLPNDVRQALLAGNGVQAAALLTLHVETQMNALYSPAVHQVAESLLRGVAIQQWDTLRETLQALEVPSPIPTKLPGDLIAPRAIDALYRDGLRRVQGINTTTMDALRPPLMEGIAQGHPTPRIARELVPKIGLTTQQARALDTYAEGLEGLPAAKREARIERKAMQLRRKRAMVISRTEVQSSLNSAIDAFWNSASGAVGLAPGALKRFWLITPGSDRTCDLCKPIPGMNPQGRDFGETFQTPKGPIDRPTLHPNCRCVIIVRPAVLVTAGPS
jgi:hypothetical protein